MLNFNDKTLGTHNMPMLLTAAPVATREPEIDDESEPDLTQEAFPHSVLGDEFTEIDVRPLSKLSFTELYAKLGRNVA